MYFDESLGNSNIWQVKAKEMSKPNQKPSAEPTLSVIWAVMHESLYILEISYYIPTHQVFFNEFTNKFLFGLNLTQNPGQINMLCHKQNIS